MIGLFKEACQRLEGGAAEQIRPAKLMTKIAYILLCHKDPEGVVAQALRLTAAGDYMAIHFDGRASSADYARIKAALAGNPAIAFAPRRIKCGWGEWSLVAATLEALKAAFDQFPAATHFYMLSGDCMPIKTAEHIHAELEAEEADFIESFDFHGSDWIKTGLKEERLIYRHWFNERENKSWFYRSLEWQQRLGLKRAIPKDLTIRIGSQWWCLRRRTVEAVLDFTANRPDVRRFFKTTWIPDETYFQTLVAHLVPDQEIHSRTLTFLHFSDYGMPVTLYNDHYDLLLTQDELFARKISPDAMELKQRLGELYLETGRKFVTAHEGRRQIQFLSLSGRVGRRFAPRFWQAETSLKRNWTVLLVACKKWHVAKRLVDRIRQVTDLKVLHYLFNEEATDIPDLGGIQSTIAKRMRHRRSLVRMLFEIWETDCLVLCVDPASVEVIEDLYRDRARIRLLYIDCTFTDDYLVGHAQRLGLAGPQSAQAVMDRLLPTIRSGINFDIERLRDMNLAGFHTLREHASTAENAAALAAFLDISVEKAREIVAIDYLFMD